MLLFLPTPYFLFPDHHIMVNKDLPVVDSYFLAQRGLTLTKPALNRKSLVGGVSPRGHPRVTPATKKKANTPFWFYKSVNDQLGSHGDVGRVGKLEQLGKVEKVEQWLRCHHEGPQGQRKVRQKVKLPVISHKKIDGDAYLSQHLELCADEVITGWQCDHVAGSHGINDSFSLSLTLNDKQKQLVRDNPAPINRPRTPALPVLDAQRLRYGTMVTSQASNHSAHASSALVTQQKRTDNLHSQLKVMLSDME